MKINELFEKIQDKFLPEDIKGEFTLNGNCIIWEYNFDNLDNNESPIPIFFDDEEEYTISFETNTPEETMLEVYNEIFEQLELFLDEIDVLNDWTISDSDILDNTITFKIF